MAGWLIDRNDEREQSAQERYWRSDLSLIATGNELCKLSCPKCGAAIFDRSCVECPYEDPREIHRLAGVITDVTEQAFQLRLNHPPEASLRDVRGVEESTSSDGLIPAITGKSDSGTWVAQLMHTFPPEGLASFAAIGRSVEVLAVRSEGTLTAVEVNG